MLHCFVYIYHFVNVCERDNMVKLRVNLCEMMDLVGLCGEKIS